jgi:hypothetical protein
MATATVAPGLETLRQEIATLEADNSGLKSKLADAEAKLHANGLEQAEVSEAIARGVRKPADSVVLLRRAEEIEASVAGLRGLLAKNQAQLDQLYPEMRRQEAEALTASRRDEVQTLAQNGAEIVSKINSKLRSILVEDFPALDPIRDRLAANELRQLGGAEVALQLIRNLTDAKGVLFEENKLTDGSMHRPASYVVRGDIQLSVRNLRKLKT